jgi:hypothetical protein
MMPWLVEKVESSSILYENCQCMRKETVDTRLHEKTDTTENYYIRFLLACLNMFT